MCLTSAFVKYALQQQNLTSPLLVGTLDDLSWQPHISRSLRQDLPTPPVLTQHHQLKTEWFPESGGAFIMLSPAEQWILHAYFVGRHELGGAIWREFFVGPNFTPC